MTTSKGLLSKDGHVIFFPDNHTYRVDGVLTPSVTTIVRTVVDMGYDSVPKHILESKASYGNDVHSIIERYALTGQSPKRFDEMPAAKQASLSLKQRQQLAYYHASLDEYKLIQDKHGIHIAESEDYIHYGYHYAGAFDMAGYIDGVPALFDIKTTYKYEPEYLSWQLGMYKLAMGNVFPVEKCYCVWLPKKAPAELIAVEPKGEAEILELIDRYENEHDLKPKAMGNPDDVLF